MSGNVDWPGRGPTWLGVPALVLALVGVLGLAEFSSRERLGRELLNSGVRTTATSVQVDVVPGKSSPFIDDVQVEFLTPEGRRIQAVLDNEEDDRQGMPEGVHPPAPGTRYALPLQLAYRSIDPSVVLAVVDAEEWTADKATPRIYIGLIAGGGSLVLVAMVLLTVGARRRGLAWWQWYAEAPGRHRL
ncbi:hypothetical protein GCM10009630_08700 [Kribbella jejuensis]|uniref:Uncharacterized protein n=1 Tax=Kribbella jejuensis TaxID=236068 RepID=A0A542EVH9_9ACTN|nr:hypothetical protein [Kribbella jejuensis]TQJ19367.1 hypothetical protein FB475_3532 [Kribbella jejuensis]